MGRTRVVRVMVSIRVRVRIRARLRLRLRVFRVGVKSRVTVIVRIRD